MLERDLVALAHRVLLTGPNDVVDRLVRLRAFLTDPEEAPLVYGALKKAVPSDPPTVMVTGVPGPFPVPGATVMLDAVAEAG